MPINVNGKLPAVKTLTAEGVFVMTSETAEKQDIRPLRIAILNLMPLKTQTETHLLRLLGCTPLQVEITLFYPKTHTPKNTSGEYLREFYKTFDRIRNEKYDGLIVTGAPVEQIPFEGVTYWDELCEIFEWSKKNVFSTLHICWGAQAGLYYHFGIQKHMLESKVSGVYRHVCTDIRSALCRGFDDYFYAPHSRYTCVCSEDINNNPSLDLLAYSDEVGPYIVSSRNGRQVFVLGHPEYERDTLKNEYFRDIDRGLNIKMPQNYFIGNDISKGVLDLWQGHSNLLFRNWLNYFVYQETPFDISTIAE